MHTTAIEQGACKPTLKWPLLGGTVAVLLLCYLWMPAYTELQDEVGYMLRVTARVAFILLLLAYVARPLVRLFGVGKVLVQHRRYLGLSMAIAHTVHFGYVVALIAALDGELGWITAVFGGLAFVLMWVMAATANNASQRAMKRSWKRVHTFGLHYLWLIFMQSFVGAAVREDPYYLYSMLSLAGFAALSLRVFAYRASKRAT